MLDIMIKLTKGAGTAVMALMLVITFPSLLQAQCDFLDDISVSTSGFQTDSDYTQEYVLVDDASDEILQINSTGSFTGISGVYRVYAINFRDSRPTIVATGNSWAGVSTYDSDSDNCFDASTAYGGGSITVCEEVCNGTDIVVSSTGFENGVGFSQTYVLVNETGTILASNTTGTFTDSDYSGVAEYNVYAVNTDDATVTAEIADNGAWSDIPTLEGSTCTKIIGPRIFGIEACCTAATATFSVVPDCNNTQFSVEVVISALGDASSVNVKDASTTHESGVGTGTYTAGPYASGSSQVIRVEDAADATCTTVSGAQTFTCLTLPACNTISGSSDPVDDDFTSAPSGWTTGSWVRGTSAGTYPITAGDGDYMYINDANSNGTHLPTTMYSPTVDAASASSLTLEFDYVFREWSSSVDDYFQVEVYTGSVWTSVFSIGGSADTENTTWTTESIDVTAYKNSAFQARFIYHDGSSWAYWVGVDNVKITKVVASTDPDVMLAGSSVTAYPQC